MQFKVPQNIDLEDKIVGPLTLIQFVYVLVGGLIIYILFNTLKNYIGIFYLLAIPIGAVSLSLAFLKIQDQPLIHFIQAGLQFLSNPKTRYWHRQGIPPTVIVEAPKIAKTKTAPPPKKVIERSELEKLAYVLDTKPMNYEEEKNFGHIATGFEKLLRTDVGRRVLQGGQSAIMGKSQATNSQHAGNS